MVVVSAIFERLEPGVAPGFMIRIHVIGSGFEHRAAPVLARIAEAKIQRIIIGPDGAGFTGLLAQTPRNGDQLFVRYADETEFSTGVIFGSFANI
jgi:hypothetical protein